MFLESIVRAFKSKRVLAGARLFFGVFFDLNKTFSNTGEKYLHENPQVHVSHGWTEATKTNMVFKGPTLYKNYFTNVL